MSAIVAAQSFFPSPSQGESEIFPFSDPRVYRSLSRAGLLLQRIAADLAPALKSWVKIDPLRVGIYAALAEFAVHAPTLEALVQGESAGEPASATLRKYLPPKHCFVSMPNIASAQIAIGHAVMGPLFTFTHSRLGSFQALEQADFDLENGIIDAAFVCSAFSLEDPIRNLNPERPELKGKLLSEAAAGMVLVKSSAALAWKELAAEPDPDFDYEIAAPLVNIVRNIKGTLDE